MPLRLLRLCPCVPVSLCPTPQKTRPVACPNAAFAVQLLKYQSMLGIAPVKSATTGDAEAGADTTPEGASISPADSLVPASAPGVADTAELVEPSTAT